MMIIIRPGLRNFFLRDYRHETFDSRVRYRRDVSDLRCDWRMGTDLLSQRPSCRLYQLVHDETGPARDGLQLRS